MALTDYPGDLQQAAAKRRLSPEERAANIQAQYDTPVTGGYNLPREQQPTPRVGSPFFQDAGQARAAGLLDLFREGLTSKAGGDVNTLPGGAGAATRAVQSVQPGTTGASLSDLTLRSLGAQRADAPASTTAAAPQMDPSLSSLRVQPQATPFTQASLRQPDIQSTPAPAGNGYQRTGLSDGSGQSIVGKRDANGRMSFSNRPEDTAGADGSLRGYGQGNLSVISGGQEGMERNLRAAAIYQQTRRDNAPVGGGLTIVPDSTRGTQAEQQRNARRQQPSLSDFQPAPAQRQGSDQDLQQNQLATQKARQELAMGGLQLQQAQRDADLRQRAQAGDQGALQTLRSLTPDKTRFQTIDTEGAAGLDGKPVILRKLYDTYTGQVIDGGAAAQAPAKAQSFVDGQVYTDAAGNRARYVNGQWNPL
ncbi:hypothetical protein [uncultured Pseudomonas sp.]|uniref:hypothetical protein n=1 Tax=uncultured Pseudomonas sp. TaxID=114707 RepID=UPI0025E24EA1|nr:hypothetical protein [uncultured Pseudomonas sp.]